MVKKRTQDGFDYTNSGYICEWDSEQNKNSDDEVESDGNSKDSVNGDSANNTDSDSTSKIPVGETHTHMSSVISGHSVSIN